MDFRWMAKKYLPKEITDFLRRTLPESVYYPTYGRTTLSTKKMDSLTRLLDQCLSAKLSGDLIECGVFRGGSLVEIGRIAKERAPSKTVFGADTFEGHPFDGPEDVPPDQQVIHRAGLFSSNSYDRVAGMLKDNGLANTILLKGLVGDTLPTLGDRKFCFAHLDLDLYISTKQALAYIAPRLVAGGIIVFDDFGAFESPGVEKAVFEALPGADVKRVPIDPSEGSQGFWVKPLQSGSSV
jgi:O-methyltransferase